MNKDQDIAIVIFLQPTYVMNNIINRNAKFMASNL